MPFQLSGAISTCCNGSFFAFLIALFGTLGDLFESALKRAAKVKDAGNIIPGHGGILDRLDSFLFAAPIGYFYLHFFA
jgi:phosphatidate cytidylyltransferase